MTLRNAFEGLATEVLQTATNTLIAATNALVESLVGLVATEQTLTAVRDNLDDVASETTLRRLLANLNFSRDANDQLRVTVNNTLTATTIGVQMWNQGAYVNWYATGGPNSVDAREPLALQRRAAAQQVQQRWTYT